MAVNGNWQLDTNRNTIVIDVVDAKHSKANRGRGN
jgi:hypothetical protein